MHGSPLVAAEIANRVGGRLTGDSERTISGIAPLSQAGSDQASFLRDPRKLNMALSSGAGLILVPEDAAHAKRFGYFALAVARQNLGARNMALREGDYDEVQRVDALIEEYNAGLPEGAQKSRITSDTKQRSFKSFGRTTSDMRGGMTYTPFMEKSLQEFDQGFQLF